MAGGDSQRMKHTPEPLESQTQQATLPTGPTGVVHKGGGGVPWMKRCAETVCPGGAPGKAVFMVLASFVADENRDAWPSVVKLASMAGLSERGCRNALRALEGAGLIRTEKVVGKSSRYRLTPAPRAGVSTFNPGTSCPTPRHLVPHTPAPRAPEVIKKLSEKLSKAVRTPPNPPVRGKSSMPKNPRRQKRAERQYRELWATDNKTPLPDDPADWPQPVITLDTPFEVEELFEKATGLWGIRQIPSRRRRRDTDTRSALIDQTRRERKLAELTGGLS